MGPLLSNRRDEYWVRHVKECPNTNTGPDDCYVAKTLVDTVEHYKTDPKTKEKVVDYIDYYYDCKYGVCYKSRKCTYNDKVTQFVTCTCPNKDVSPANKCFNNMDASDFINTCLESLSSGI